MSYIRAGRGWLLAAALLAMPLTLAGHASAQPEKQAAAKPAPAAALNDRAWDLATTGRSDALLELIAQRPVSERHAEMVTLYRTNREARETRRTEEMEKVRERLAKILEDNSDLGVSDALRAAVELAMLSPEKEAILEEPKIQDLVQRAERALEQARKRGDWLTTSDLSFRLNMLFDEREGKYAEAFRRESRRLAMIRLYAPQRLWELRNERRNAELARQDVLREKGLLDDEADGDEESADQRPLPPYNPIGDSYEQKLAGIERTIVINSLGRAYDRHIDQRGMHEILIGALEALRTLVTTTDLEDIFPGLADAEAREEFLAFVDAEQERVERLGMRAGRADMMTVLNKTIARNESTLALPTEALLHEFGNGGMAALDEFSAIVWPDDIRRFERNTQGRFIGVGIQIELDPLSNIRVVTPLEGTPAQRAGIRPGDLIKKVNGESTIGFTLEQAVDVITGPENTQVVLTIERDEGQEGVREVEFNLRRAVIPIYTVRGWKRLGPREDAWEWFIDPESRIGYIRLTGFNERTAGEFDQAVASMKRQGLSALILDLRHNPGGLLEQSVEIASRFIDRTRTKNFSGLIVTTHDKDNRLRQQERARIGRATLSDIPVAVLINKGSASASEIVAGALQDYASVGDVRAIVVGDRSYGKGSVQNVWPFQHPAPGAAVKVTTQTYHLPSGRTIHRTDGAETWGVEPDLTVEMLPAQIAEAFQLRLNADVIRVDEHGEIMVDEESPDPEDLLRNGIDLQLHKALVVLQSQVPSGLDDGRTLVDKPDAR